LYCRVPGRTLTVLIEIFLSPSRQMPECERRLGHYILLPRRFWFISHYRLTIRSHIILN
jgi:hypothetical protein